MIDHIDMEIIRCLHENARQQWKKIGEVVNMPGVAVANLIQSLEEMGSYRKDTLSKLIQKTSGTFTSSLLS